MSDVTSHAIAIYNLRRQLGLLATPHSSAIGRRFTFGEWIIKITTESNGPGWRIGDGLHCTKSS